MWLWILIWLLTLALWTGIGIGVLFFLMSLIGKKHIDLIVAAVLIIFWPATIAFFVALILLARILPRK